jgi:hypothetical protein
MCAESVATENFAAALIPPIEASAPDDVRDVIPLPGYRLAVRFHDGTAGTVDMAAMITAPTAGVFARLRDPVEFARVHVLYGVVTWPGELDLAPDAMHDALAATGEWVLGAVLS